MKTLEQRAKDSKFIANTKIAKLFSYVIKKRKFNTYANYPIQVDNYCIAISKTYEMLVEKTKIDFTFNNDFELPNSFSIKHKSILTGLKYTDNLNKFFEFEVSVQFKKIFHHLYAKHTKNRHNTYIKIQKIGLSLEILRVIMYALKLTKTNIIKWCIMDNLIYIKIQEFKFLFIPIM